MSAVRLTFLYDGACAICAAEAARLECWNRRRETLRFVDISATGFDPSPYGKSLPELMGRAHAFRPDGGVLFDRFYLWFARNRYRLSGALRCNDGRCAS